MTHSVAAIFDLDRHPLDRPRSRRYARLVADMRRDWRAGNGFALRGLIRPEAVRQAAAELHRPMESVAFRHRQTHNIYFSDGTESLPLDLGEQRLVTANRTLTCDQMAGTIIRSVYEWDPLRAFIQRALELPALHRMADPMACLNVMAYGDGDGLGWHFDRAEFAVTILLQSAGEGGRFEYRCGLRTANDPNYTGVRRLLDGEDHEIQQAVSAPGDMTVFAGSDSAHRVTPVIGDTPRMMAVLSYMTVPGYHYGPDDRRRFYGRATPAGTSVRRVAPAE